MKETVRVAGGQGLARKCSRFILLLFSFCVFAGVGISQKASEPELIHKYSHAFCEYGRSSIDIFLKELTNSPDTKGVIILHGSPNDPLFPYKEKATIINHLIFRNFDKNRINFVLGEHEIRSSTELWEVPANKLADFKGKPWDRKVPDLSDPLLVHSERWVDGIGCGLFLFSFDFFADFLNENKDDIFGRVIIREKTFAKYQRKKASIIKELVGKQKVPAKNLEFAFIQDKTPDVEYWFFPKCIFWCHNDY